MGALERDGDHPTGPRGCVWAVCRASLSPFLSFRLEGGRRPSWAQLPNMCLRFYGDFSTPIRVPLIVVPDKFNFQPLIIKLDNI